MRRALGVLLSISLISAGVGQAQTASGLTELQEERSEQGFTDPLTTLPQLVVRDGFSPVNYGADAWVDEVIVKPLIPRVPPRLCFRSPN